MADPWEQAATYVLSTVVRHDGDLRDLHAKIDRLEARVNQLIMYFLATSVGAVITLAAYIVTQR